MNKVVPIRSTIPLSQENLEQKVTTVQVFGLLGRETTVGDISRAYWNEYKKNSWFEIPCVGSCEVGDFSGVAAFQYVLGLSSQAHPFPSNLAGFVSGAVIGFGYGSWHYGRDADKKSYNASFKEIAEAVATAESGCILGATATTSILGVAASQYPLVSQEGIGIRLASMVPAYLIGTALMSAMTLRQKQEASRMIAQKGALPELEDFVYRDLKITDGQALHGSIASDIELKDDKLILQGVNSELVVKEKPLPTGYHKDFNPETNSLYLVQSPLARYFHDARKTLRNFVSDSFNGIGYNPTIVRNPFVHEHICDH